MAAGLVPAQRDRALDRRCAAGRAFCLHRPGALPPGRRTLRSRSGRRRHARGALRPPPARGHPRPVRRAVPGRAMPGRCGDRHDRCSPLATSPTGSGTRCMSEMMDNRVLALAGVAQALAQVRRIADTGQADATVLATALDSVFRIDAASPAAVYGDASALRPGLLLLRSYFRNESEDALLPRLGLAVLQLERRFVRDEAAGRVHQRIPALSAEADRQGGTHPVVLAPLAGLYADTAHTSRPRGVV